MKRMKLTLTIFSFLIVAQPVMAQNEIGPEGGKLLGLVIILLLLALLGVVILRSTKSSRRFKWPSFRREKIKVELFKDRLYYPDILELRISNNGKTDVDIQQPLLVLSSIWLSRKFKLKGTNNLHFYPLFLMKGQNHSLKIDLNRFYGFDRTLKRLPKAKVIVSDVKGKKLGSQRVMLRKTLFNF